MRNSQQWDESRRRLLDWTGPQGASEYLAGQVLMDQGFKELDPSHPLGGRDGGADALAERNGLRWVMAVYFPRGQQTIADIKKKFIDDSAGVERNEVDALAFVTNQELRRAERRDLMDAVDFPVKLYHLDRVVTILDQPRMYGVRHQFLGIDPPEGLERDERLEELWRASLGRCEARWKSVGLPEVEASELALDQEMGAVSPELCPSYETPLAVWTAPLGSGKSIAADRHHQRTLELARASLEAPLPVFLRAVECAAGLQPAVEDGAAELGEPRRVGAAVVIDGVDEVGHAVADALLNQARALVRTWPSTTVLITARSVPVLTEAAEHMRFPALTPDQQEQCVSIGAGPGAWRPNLRSLPQAVQATLGQPMFALLTGLWMRERREVPGAQIDLMRLLGERATRGLTVDESHLRRLATLSVARDLGAVPVGEIFQGASPDDFLATGMIEQRGRGVAFVLPAVAQWFAAQAMLTRELDTRNLLAAPEDLELWRYPLALTVSLGSAAQASDLLQPLLENQAGFALHVLDTAFGQAILGGAPPPPWREGGTQVRAVLQALADSVGPLAPLIFDTDQDGRVLPMAVASSEHHLTIAFWGGDEPKPEVFQLPAGHFALDPLPGWGWGRVRGARVGPGGAWAWEWALGGARMTVDRLLKNRQLPIPLGGPLAAEVVWAASCDLVLESTLRCESIAFDRILQAIDNVPAAVFDEHGPLTFRSGNAHHDLRGLRKYIGAASARGETKLVPLVPPADIALPGSGFIGNLYSERRIVEVAEAMYKHAIVGYRQLVERWLPTLKNSLEHYVLMPMKIVGFASTGRGGAHAIGPIPHLAGYIEALPPGSADEVSMSLGSWEFDDERGIRSYEQQRAARPEAARWVSGRRGGMTFEVGDKYPISDVVYRWLASDLHRIGLAPTAHFGRHNGSLVVWDVTPADEALEPADA